MCSKETTDIPLEVTFSFVAFADILGYSELLKECSNNPTQANDELKKIYEALHTGLENLKTPDGKCIVKIFTDNLLLKYPKNIKIADIKEIDCINLFQLLSYYQLSLVLKGYFVRGAVTIGDTYIDEEIAFGYPIVEAYGLESKIAKDPRIIISEKAYQLVRYFANHWTTKEKIFSEFLLKDLRDKDGYYFINYLQILIENREWVHHSTIIGYLLSHKERVEHELKCVHPYNVMSKYEWVASYHDFFCQYYYPEEKELLINHGEKHSFDYFRI